MRLKRNIRALVIINPVNFFYTGGHPMGVDYEALRELEKYVNDKYVPSEGLVYSVKAGPVGGWVGAGSR
jgi:hypothetical protein